MPIARRRVSSFGFRSELLFLRWVGGHVISQVGALIASAVSTSLVMTGQPPPQDYDDYGSVPPDSGGIPGFVIWGVIGVVVFVIWLKTTKD